VTGASQEMLYMAVSRFLKFTIQNNFSGFGFRPWKRLARAPH
jgi:hypothetical protein